MKFSSAFDIVLATMVFHGGHVPNEDVMALAQAIDADSKVIFHPEGGFTIKFKDESEAFFAD